MKQSLHRESADSQRAAAAATNLPNVRERHLRSAEAHDAVAALEEKTAAAYHARVEITAAKRSGTDE